MSFLKKDWMRLDNAAKIFPAARRRNWSNVFRVAATMKDTVDPDVLSSALTVTVKRFPSIAVRVKKGVFWYYLEKIDSAPEVREDEPYPCRKMSEKESAACAFRVLYYKRRIAVEVFHAVTDGTGAMTFLKSLVAEYAERKYGIKVPEFEGILDRDEPPRPEETEDSFFTHEGKYAASRKESTAYHISGKKEPWGYLNITTGIISLPDIKREAGKYSATVTVYLAAKMIECILGIQREDSRARKRRQPVKVQIPVNLRNIFSSQTLRNFSLFASVGIEQPLVEYSLSDIIEIVRHQLGLKVTPQAMQALITSNTRPEHSFALRIAPLPLKNVVMKAVYNAVAERTTCTEISNMGLQKLPCELSAYVESLEFVLGILADTAYCCSAVSYGNELRFTFTSNIKGHELERRFFTSLVKSGIHVKIENNEKEDET